MGVWTSNPEFRWSVRGKAMYDPRKDSSVGGSGPQRWNTPSTYTFSKNAKVIEYNIIRGLYYKGDRVWGGGAEAYRLPLDYWFAAMNVCDENIEKKNGTIINRYEVGAEIHFDDKPIEIIDEINKATCGYTTEYGGTYKTWCGSPGLSVATITDDDFLISAEMETNRSQALQNVYNTAYATYPEPDEQWEIKDGPQYQDADALAEDGQELAIDIALPLVSENNQVQRVMRATVKDSRRQVTHAGQLPPEAFVLEPNDRISFISSTFGYHGDGKDFILSSKEDLANVNQQVLLRELNPDDTGWLKAYELDYRVGALTVVKPGTLDLDFTVVASQIDSAVGKDKPAILVTWDWSQIDIDVQNIRWEVRRAGTTTVIAEGRIRNPDVGSRRFANTVFRFGKSYEIRLKPEPYSDRQTTWTGWKPVTLVNVDVPGAPTLTRVIQQADDGTQVFYLDITWTAIAAEGSYIVRVISDGVTRRHKAEENERRIPVTSGKTYVVDVRFKAADGGTLGDYSSSTTITISKKNIATIPSPAGLTIAAGSKRNKLDWTDVNDDLYPDYRNTWIWRNQTGTTPVVGTTASYRRTKAGYFIDDNLAIGATYYYWIAHKDNSGLFSALAGPVSSAVAGLTVAELPPIDTSNMVQGPDLSDTAMWVTNLAGLTRAVPNIVSASQYRLVAFPATTSACYIQPAPAYRIPVEGGKRYTYSASIGSNIAVSATFDLRINWFSRDASGNPVSISQITVASFTGSTIQKLLGVALAPANASWAEIVALKNSSAVASSLELNEPVFRRTIDNDLIGPEAVSDDKTNQTPPDTVSGSVTIGPGILEVLSDGTVQAHTDVSWAAITTGVPVKDYVIKVTQVSNGKARIIESDTNSASVEVKTGRSYTYQVAGRNAFGKRGTLTTAVSYTRANKPANLPTPAGLTIAANSKRNKIDWTDVDDDAYPDYRNTWIWRNQTGTTPTPGTTPRFKSTKAGYYVDDNLAIGAGAYYYWIAHKDNTGNFSALAGPVSSAVVGLTAAELPAVDTSNMVMGSDLVEPALWAGTGGLLQGQPNIVSASKFRLVSITSSTATTRIQSAPDYRIPVEADTQYTMSASIGSPIAVSANYSLRINWYSRDASGNAVSISQSIAASFVGTTISYLVGTVVSPSNASWAEFLVLKSASASASPIELNEPVFRRTIDGDLLADGTINKAKTTTATPSTPGAGTLTVAQDPRTVQADGTVQMTAKLTASSLPANAETITFDVDYSYPAGTDIKSFDAGKGLSVTIPVNYNQTIGVTYKGVGFNENAGPPIASPVTLTPVRKSGAPNDPSLVILSPAPLAMFVGWDDPTAGFGLPDYDHTEVYFYPSASFPPSSSTQPTITAQGTGVLFYVGYVADLWVWVRHVNNSGIKSNWVTSFPVHALTLSLGTAQVNGTFFNDGLVAIPLADMGDTAFLKKVNAGTANAGSTENGANLVYSDTSLSTGSSPGSGTTWEARGRCTAGQATMWKRVG